MWMGIMKNRSREEIVEAFLKAVDAVGDRGVTAVLRRANYEYDYGRAYVDVLLRNQAIEPYEDGYHLTDIGRQYLRYLTAQNMLMRIKNESSTRTGRGT